IVFELGGEAFPAHAGMNRSSAASLSALSCVPRARGDEPTGMILMGWHYRFKPMNDNVIIWDIETIPDLRGFAAANYLTGKTDAEIREVMGDKFPKHIYHSIVCIGALVAHREDDKWVVDAIGAPHIGERSEKELVQAFVGKIADLTPQLVTFNGNSFDLPVLRYRAMVHSVAAAGLSVRPYFNRYTDDAIDLCDVLSSFASQAKATLHEIC